MKFSLATHHRLVLALAALAGGAVAFSTNAQDRPAQLGLCAACHGERGIATARTIPNLAGQNLDYLRSALIQYQTGARDVATMRAAVGMLNAAQLDGLLQWYSGQSPATP
jgi:cytochrome c553